MTYASTRRIFGQVYANLPSRFIVEAQLLFGGPGPAVPEGAVRPPLAVGGQSKRLSSCGAKVGMRVSHPDFGGGRVADAAGSGDALKVTVIFDDGRSAKFLARYAPLEKE
jgi:DNA helicase-2/ATP-dependent DNA helicase PcrA